MPRSVPDDDLMNEQQSLDLGHPTKHEESPAERLKRELGVDDLSGASEKTNTEEPMDWRRSIISDGRPGPKGQDRIAVRKPVKSSVT
ncbi:MULTISPECIES: hypothetical protein [Chelativorans]|nr:MULTISPECIES: hypothetical protein [Chelativorans]